MRTAASGASARGSRILRVCSCPAGFVKPRMPSARRKTDKIQDELQTLGNSRRCRRKFTGCDAEVRSVVTDSRSLSCELGCCPMFVAMRGANHDSHGFVAQMSARGVRAFLVERDVECPADCGFVRVDNAIDALQRLAAHYRAQFRVRSSASPVRTARPSSRSGSPKNCPRG